MAREVLYISLDEVIWLHDQEIQSWGGSMGIRDLAMLESAVFRPQSSFGGKDLYETILAKASALMHSIILNHPFVDGNKRTSVVVLGRFLYLNGYRLHVQNKELVLITQQVGVKELGLEGLTKWLEIHCSKS